jgi:ribosomal protein S4E
VKRGKPRSYILFSGFRVKPGMTCYYLVNMKSDANKKLKDGAKCKIIAGTHAGKSGVVQDMHTSKTGAVTITVRQANGDRFKTLAKNVQVTG